MNKCKTMIFLLLWLAASVTIQAQIQTPASGYINTIAGNGTVGNSGDGGVAISAQFRTPERVTVDGAGNVYVADLGNNRIQKITAATGVITTVAGTGTAGFYGDGGAATSAELNEPYAVASDREGDLYIADFGNNRIRKVSAEGIISTIAGGSTAGSTGDNGAATGALLNQPSGLTVDLSGNIYFSDHGNYKIREINGATGVITTIAGTGTSGYSGDGSTATNAKISSSYAVAVDPSGNVYVSDHGANRIRMISPVTGNITSVIGNGTAGSSGDGGSATSAEINAPSGLCADAAGDLFVADTTNNKIRKLTAATGLISTVAGTGTDSFSGDGGLATSAKLGLPQDVAIDDNGTLYVDDYANGRIRNIGAVKISSIVVLALSTASQAYGVNSPTVVATVPNGAGTVTFSTSFGWNSGAITVSSGSATAIVNTSGVQVGSYTITAAYSGNNAYTATNANIGYHVTAGTPAIIWPSPAPITYLTPLSGTQLNATSSVPGTFTYSPASGTILSAGTHTLTVTFAPTDTADYSTSGSSVVVTVNKSPTISAWSPPSAITVGTSLSTTQLAATATAAGNSVSGSYTYTPTFGYIPAVGNTTLSVSFTPTDTADFLPSTANVTLDTVTTQLLTMYPLSGPPGTTVTITNNGFGSTQGTSTITLNGNSIQPASWTQGTITFSIPSGQVAGTIDVAMNIGGSIAAQQTFTVLPTITGLGFASTTPSAISLSGPAGVGFIITGAGFGPSPAVTLNGSPLTVLSSNGTTQITVQVGSIFGAGGPWQLVVNSGGALSVDQAAFTVTSPESCKAN